MKQPASASVLRHLFELLGLDKLARNQRFVLAWFAIATVFFGVSLRAPFQPGHYFMLALLILLISGLGLHTNLRS